MEWCEFAPSCSRSRRAGTSAPRRRSSTIWRSSSSPRATRSCAREQTDEHAPTSGDRPMKGVIFNLLQEVVTRAHGEDVWDSMLDASGLAGAYTSLGSYHDEDLKKLVDAACKACGLSHCDALRRV